MSTIRLTDCIAPSFYDLHHLVKTNAFTHYWLKGGRGSTKSSFVSVEIILGIIQDKEANAICFRKVGDTLKDSCYAQILWAIDKLGVSNYFDTRLSPLRIYYKPTGQAIFFRGLDDPKKTKSIKLKKGYFKFAWFEELDEFDGMEEIRLVTQSILRGGKLFTYFYSYNPPQKTNSWVNAEAQIAHPRRHVHSSTYLDVPKEWNGENFHIEAELLKNTNSQAYDHEYLGIATGTGLNVFTNVVGRPITDYEIKAFDNIRQGIDWGFAVDPFVYIKLHYDKTRRKIYIFDEVYKVGFSNDEAIKKLHMKVEKYGNIIADSAEPKSISEFRNAGFNIRAAAKGAGSIHFGIKKLQGLIEIVIDPARCPNTYKEFINYEYEKMKDGTVRSDYPDKNNHCLDSVRYATELDFFNKGAF